MRDARTRIALMLGLAVAFLPGPGVAQGFRNGCEGRDLMASISTDFQQFHRSVPSGSRSLLAALNPGALRGETNPFEVLRQAGLYLFEALEAGAGLMPYTGAVSLSTGVGSRVFGGVVCTDPVGDNYMLDVGIIPTLPTVTGIQSQAVLATYQGDIARLLANLTPQQRRDFTAAMTPKYFGTPGQIAAENALGFPVSLPPSVMKDLEGMAMFEVYSPNAVSWLFGGGLLEPTADMSIYEHAGARGWPSNSAFHAWIVLPGKRVSELEEGEVYTAVVPQLGTDPLYVRADGSWVHRDPKLQVCSWKGPGIGFTVDSAYQDELPAHREVFEGQITVLTPIEMFGDLQVDSVWDGSMRVSFDLSGEATLELHEYERVYSDDGLQDTCEYGGVGNIIRTNRINTSTTPSLITLTGSTYVPAVADTGRAARRIAYVRKVSPPPPEDWF